MKITWYINDGYVNNDRPHTIEIYDEEIEECRDVNDAMQFINDCIMDEFYDNTSVEYDDLELRERVRILMETPPDHDDE